MNPINQREQHITKFYQLLDILEEKLGSKQKLDLCHGRMSWPQRGIYFFFEQGEMRKDNPTKMRLVRVGTHAVSEGSKTTLWKRLNQHRGTGNGGGNHRGSIFRHHIGTALIAKSNGVIRLPSWSDRSNRTKEIVLAELEHEKRVSAYIRQMPFLWLAIWDEPSAQSERAFVERNAISLLAGITGDEPLDPPNENWLGSYSPEAKIRESGLWNLNHVGDQGKPYNYNSDFLRVMAKHVEAL